MAAARARKQPDISTCSGRLAVRIRMLRERAGLSVEECVALMQRYDHWLQPSTLYAWENGQARPNIDAMPAFAKTVKVKLRTVFPDE